MKRRPGVPPAPAAAHGGPLAGSGDYAYTTARLLILVAVLWVAYLGEWRRRWRPLAATSLVALASYAPMAIWSLQHPGQLTARFNSLSILCRPVSSCNARPGIVGNSDDGSFFALVVAERLWRVYSSGWSPSFLVYSGDPYGRHVTGHGGTLYAALAPLLVVIMTLGAAELIRLLRGQRWIAVALGVAVLVEMGGFMTDYFTAYPARSRTRSARHRQRRRYLDAVLLLRRWVFRKT